MSLLPAGSVPWLLSYEMRMMFRNTSRGSRIGMAIAVGMIALLMLVAGLPAAVALRHYTLALSPVVTLTIDVGLVVLFALLLSQTLAAATFAFYDRGDLDLLLSSPVPPRRVLTVRALAIAMAPFVMFASLVTPFLVPLAFYRHAAWLAAYGVLASLALSATAVGLIVAMALFRAIGPRRTKTVGQILAGVIGMFFFLLTQSTNIFPHRGLVVASALMAMAHAVGPNLSGLLSWPARAVVGDPIPLTVFMSSAVALFVLSAWTLGSRFALDTSLAAGVDATRRGARPSRIAGAFQTGVTRALVRKELTLLARDPALLSQVLLRVVYLVVLQIVLLSKAISHVDSAVITGSGTIAFVASQVAASLAWIAISGEDAPDLLRAAPIDRWTIQRAKLVAVLVPIVVLLSAPLAALAWFSLRAAAVAATGVIGASISSCLINLWYEKPGQRKDFRRRSNSGSLAATIAELIVGLGWAATVVVAASGSLWALLMLAITLAALFAFSIGRIDREVG